MSKDLVLSTVNENLKDLLQKKSEALPKTFNEVRFVQNCMAVLSDTKGIENCDPKSVARTMLQGAFLGLDFFSRECYAIPYGGQLQFQTDYKGEIKLAKKYSINPIKEIYAKVVKEGDVFEAKIVDGKQLVNFTPLSFNDGEIIGAFAVVMFQNGEMAYDAMSKKDIENTRKLYSKMPDGKAWKNSTEEMYKKTVLRRLCKLIELDFEHYEQKNAFEEGSDFDVKKESPKVEVLDPFTKESQDADIVTSERVPQPIRE